MSCQWYASPAVKIEKSYFCAHGGLWQCLHDERPVPRGRWLSIDPRSAASGEGIAVSFSWPIHSLPSNALPYVDLQQCSLWSPFAACKAILHSNPPPVHRMTGWALTRFPPETCRKLLMGHGINIDDFSFHRWMPLAGNNTNSRFSMADSRTLEESSGVRCGCRWLQWFRCGIPRNSLWRG